MPSSGRNIAPSADSDVDSRSFSHGDTYNDGYDYGYEQGCDDAAASKNISFFRQ